MTKLLEKAVKEVNKLSGKEQNELAQIILDEIEDEKMWEESFNKSQDTLSKLEEEALHEFNEGKTKPLDI